MANETKPKLLLRIAVAAILVAIIATRNPVTGLGNAIFIVPIMFFAIYLWLGVAFFFVELIWMLLTKPEERLFAINMLSGAVMVTVALAAGYWLIHDSIGVVATILYAIAAYSVLSIVRWFRRHTASYYAALEANDREADPPEQETDKPS